MIRGTTPTICFELPIVIEQIEECWLTIAQRGEEIITKTKDDLEFDGEKYTVRLTQEETLRLNDNQYAKIQLRLRTTGNDALASDVVQVDVHEILKDGVI